MPTTLIPWRAFFKELQRQNSETLQDWLGHWIFTNNGAAMINKPEKQKAESLSLEEKQMRAVLFLLALERGSRTLH